MTSRPQMILFGVAGLLLVAACSSGESTTSTSVTTTRVTELTSGPAGVGCEYESSPDLQEFEHLPDVSPGDRWSMLCTSESSGSLAAWELSGDNVPDVIVPVPNAGHPAHNDLILIDGESKAVRWRQALGHDVVSVPLVVDHDGEVTVLVAGRAESNGPDDPGPLTALDGRTGDVRWQLQPRSGGWQNVYTPEVVGDVTGDGIDDLVIASGGDQARAVLDLPTRSGGVFLIDGSDGSTISSALLPEGQETYSSPLVVRTDDHDWVVVGSGGEVLPGNAWRVPLDDLMKGSEATFIPMIVAGAGQTDELPPDATAEQIESAVGRGVAVISPPALGQTEDGRQVVVVVDMAGGVHGFDPSTWRALWRVEPAATGAVPGHLLDGRAVAGFAAPVVHGSSAAVVVTQTMVTVDDLIAARPQLGHMLVSVLDLEDGAVSSQLVVENANSVSSPLVLDGPDAPLILCTCSAREPSEAGRTDREAHRPEPQGLGLWDPAAGSVEPLGLRGSVESTPALATSGDDLLLLAGSTVRFPETDDLWAVTLRTLRASAEQDRWSPVSGTYLWDRQRRAIDQG